MEALKDAPIPELNIDPPLPAPPRRSRAQALFAPELVRPAIKEAFLMLRPEVQWRNPVMFVVEIGAVLTALFIIQAAGANPARYQSTISLLSISGCG